MGNRPPLLSSSQQTDNRWLCCKVIVLGAIALNGWLTEALMLSSDETRATQD